MAALERPLPLTARPFAQIADETGIPEDVVIERIQGWLSAGVIRRFGARIAHRGIGYTANGMSVWNVPDDRLDEAGRTVAAFREVSHCYARPRAPGWPYNLFAMIHAHRREKVLAVVRRIAGAIGPAEHDVLFSVKEFKKTAPRLFNREGTSEEAAST